MELSPLERAVLDLLVAGDSGAARILQQQAAHCSVRGRTQTGAGFYSYFAADGTAPAAAEWADALVRIGGVEGEIPGLERGAGFILYVTNGLLDLLEGYSYEEPWPETIEAFSLRYDGVGPAILAPGP